MDTGHDEPPFFGLGLSQALVLDVLPVNWLQDAQDPQDPHIPFTTPNIRKSHKSSYFRVKLKRIIFGL